MLNSLVKPSKYAPKYAPTTRGLGYPPGGRDATVQAFALDQAGKAGHSTGFGLQTGLFTGSPSSKIARFELPACLKTAKGPA